MGDGNVLCWIVHVYTADDDLRPFTRYNYSLTASNRVGSVTSAWTTATTHEAKPSQLAGPNCETRDDRLDTIHLSWSAPAIANGLWVCLSVCLSSVLRYTGYCPRHCCAVVYTLSSSVGHVTTFAQSHPATYSWITLVRLCVTKITGSGCMKVSE